MKSQLSGSGEGTHHGSSGMSAPPNFPTTQVSPGQNLPLHPHPGPPSSCLAADKPETWPHRIYSTSPGSCRPGGLLAPGGRSAHTRPGWGLEEG